MTTVDVGAAVARGVALLDERVPDWRGRVDGATLDMSSNANCVLGQLFGHYDAGLNALELQFDGVEYGFVCGSRILCTCDALNDVWRLALRSTEEATDDDHDI